MPWYRCRVVANWEYPDIVEADTPEEAASMVYDELSDNEPLLTTDSSSLLT